MPLSDTDRIDAQACWYINELEEIGKELRATVGETLEVLDEAIAADVAALARLDRDVSDLHDLLFTHWVAMGAP